MNLLGIVDIAESQFKKTKSIPNSLRGYYTFSKGVHYGASFIIARATSSFSLDEIRRHYVLLSESFDLPVCLYLLSSSAYAIKALAKEGIPFYVEDRFAYIPFLSLLAKQKRDKTSIEIKKMSMVAQHFLIFSIFSDLRSASVSEASRLIGVSKMAISKAFDELEALNLPIQIRGRLRCFHWDLPWGNLLRFVLPHMSSPVRKEFRLAEEAKIPGCLLSGITMISSKTQLGDNDYQTLAIAKNLETIERLQNLETVPYFEKPQQIVTVMNYIVPFGGEAVDPISAWLSLPDNYPTDVRVRYEVGRLFSKIIEGWDASWPLI